MVAPTPEAIGTATSGAATVAEVQPARRLSGELHLPGDKSISHRALMLALLAEGSSVVAGAGDGADVRSTAGIVAALGAEVERAPGAGGNVDYRVRSEGSDGLRAPAGTLDCGNSGTSLRLFAGILAGQAMRAVLDGDASLRGRPIARIIEPLRAMGATVEGSGGDAFPPLTVVGRALLDPIEWSTPVPSAQVKSAILLAGLRADGTTRVRESVATRDHTERMLRARAVEVRTSAENGGRAIEIDGGAAVLPRDEQVPGDPSAAAFWLVAGAIHPDADLRLRGVGINPTRRAIVDLLRRMGTAIEETPIDGSAIELRASEGRPNHERSTDGRPNHGRPNHGRPNHGQSNHGRSNHGQSNHGRSDGNALGGVGEPVADLRVRSSTLEAIELEPADTASAIDEIPILSLAATQARGRTVIRGAGELRHKESDRIAGVVAGLRALGARIESIGDDLVIDGPTPLRGGPVDSLGDHRLALTFAIAGLVAGGRTTIAGADSVAVSYPSFFADLERIQT